MKTSVCPHCKKATDGIKQDGEIHCPYCLKIISNKPGAVVCKVGFEGYDWRNELYVKSPTGRTVKVQCNGKWDHMTPELANVIDKIKAYPWTSWPKHDFPLTKDLMKEILELSR